MAGQPKKRHNVRTQQQEAWLVESILFGDHVSLR